MVDARSLTLLVTGVLLVAPGAGEAQRPAIHRSLADSVEKRIQTAYIDGDVSAANSATAFAERAASAHPDDPLLRHYHGYALFREATVRRHFGESENLETLLNQADQILERAAASDHALPEDRAVRALVLLQKIGQNPKKAPTLGRQALGLLETAENSGPENPRVWFAKGVYLHGTPAAFGGGTERARKAFEKALSLFEAADGKRAGSGPEWGRAETLGYLGLTYAHEGSDEQARTYYQRALEVQPSFAWIDEILVPRLADAE